MRAERKKALTVAAAVLAGLVVLVVVVIVSARSTERPYGGGSAGDPGSEPSDRPLRRFGQTVRLRTYTTTIEVRPLGFARLGASAASGPAVGVDLAIRNVGRAQYREQPLQAAQVILQSDEEAERIYLPVGGCAGPSEDTIRIPVGATSRFCLPFEVTGRPDVFVYAPDDGLPGTGGAPEAAAWSFPR